MSYLKNEISKTLGAPDEIRTVACDCVHGKNGNHDFEHKFAHRITKKYVVADSDPIQFVIVQTTYCKNRGCSERHQKIWEVEE
tara:strand:- start:988 stop:1236 length:249 start_codon:yes stop_codon:yes gene_type:complete